MPNHLQIAQAFVNEQTARRDDIIAALVVGSAARGEADENSDVDIIFSVRDAVIMYDPTGSFTALQAKVRNVFMEPKWLRMRLDRILDYYTTSLGKLSRAVYATDHLGICENGMTLPHLASSVPLYMNGVTPSSTRKLFLLKEICPNMRARLVEYECELADSAIDGTALLEVCRSCCASAGRTDLGGLPEYMIGKAERTIGKGDLREGIDMLWTATGLSISRPERHDETLPHCREWLRRVGWSGSIVLAGKLRLAEDPQTEIHGMADTV